MKTGWIGDWRHPGKHHANWAKCETDSTSWLADYYSYHINLQSKKEGYALRRCGEILFTAQTIDECFDYANQHIVMEKLTSNLGNDFRNPL